MDDNYWSLNVKWNEMLSLVCDEISNEMTLLIHRNMNYQKCQCFLTFSSHRNSNFYFFFRKICHFARAYFLIIIFTTTTKILCYIPFNSNIFVCVCCFLVTFAFSRFLSRILSFFFVLLTEIAWKTVEIAFAGVLLYFFWKITFLWFTHSQPSLCVHPLQTHWILFFCDSNIL